MYPEYYETDLKSGNEVPAEIIPVSEADLRLMIRGKRQTSWMSEDILDPSLEKYALKIAATGELVALGAYRDLPQGFLVYVEYLENAPHSESIAALVAFGVQLSVDAGYGGTIYLKAKTPGDLGTLYSGSRRYSLQPQSAVFCF